MGLNTQIYVQEAKAFLSNYVHTLGDMMPDSNEVSTSKNYFHFGRTQKHCKFLLTAVSGKI